MEKSENVLKVFLNIFFAQKNLFLGTASVFVVAALLVAVFFPPVYVVRGTVIVKSKKIPSSPEDIEWRSGSKMVLPPSREDVLSETKIISSRDLIREAVDEAGPAADLAVAPGSIRIWLDRHVIDPSRRLLVRIGLVDDGEERSATESLVQEVSDSLSTIIVPGSNVIEIELLYGDARKGAAILNSMLDNYLRFRLHLFTDAGNESFFQSQVDQYRRRLDELESEKLALMNRFSVADVDKAALAQTDFIGTIERDLVEMEAEVLEKQRTLEFLRQRLAARLENDAGEHLPFSRHFEDPEIKQVIEKINALTFEYADDLKVYLPDSPKMTRSAQRIDDLKAGLLVMVRNQIDQMAYEAETLRQTLEQRRGKLEELKIQGASLREARVRLERIDDEINLSRESYHSFFQKLEAARIERASQISQQATVQVLRRALAPESPYFPDKKVVIPVGVAAGLLLGFSLGFIREFFDHTFKHPYQVERYLDLPVIGSILEDGGCASGEAEEPRRSGPRAP